MDFLSIQKDLIASGRNVGELDGQFGPKTLAAIMAYAAHSEITPKINETSAPLYGVFQQRGIVTGLQICAFIAQTCYETSGFTYYAEIASGVDYEGRVNLGNVQAGDGVRYKGRGLIMITGRANYANYGNFLHLNLIDDPDQAETPPVASEIAGLFWEKEGLNKLASQDNLYEITHRINGGQNGAAQRNLIYGRLKELFDV